MNAPGSRRGDASAERDATRGVYARVAKPALDRVAAALLLALLSPLLLVIAALITLESPGGALFVQDRIGLEGRRFRLYKFRSMVTGAEDQGTGALVEKRDPRVTRVGRVLRATSLDELPQLWNILRGDMSLIGPRPTLEYQVRQYDAFQRRRLLVRPGVTGLAQVRGRKSLDWPSRIRHDVEYVESVSLLLDARILLATCATLVRGEGQAQEDYWKERERDGGTTSPQQAAIAETEAKDAKTAGKPEDAGGRPSPGTSTRSRPPNDHHGGRRS